MAKNVMTEAMEKMTKMLIGADEKLVKYGAVPYGQRKATQKEQRQMFDNLTPDQLFQMREQYGEGAVNKFLGKFMKGGS